VATLLAASPPGARRDLYRLVVQPGHPRLSQPHPPGTMEHLVLSAGRALAGPVDAADALAPGDCLSYPADVPHIFEALESDTTAVLIVEHL
jgi:mannose-6-phosphate isomerase-like protein (cupin superfamily)